VAPAGPQPIMTSSVLLIFFAPRTTLMRSNQQGMCSVVALAVPTFSLRLAGCHGAAPLGSSAYLRANAGAAASNRQPGLSPLLGRLAGIGLARPFGVAKPVGPAGPKFLPPPEREG
jgi:hypothetical protein